MEFLPNTNVWVLSGNDGMEKGTVQSLQENIYLIKLENGRNVSVPSHCVYPDHSHEAKSHGDVSHEVKSHEAIIHPVVYCRPMIGHAQTSLFRYLDVIHASTPFVIMDKNTRELPDSLILSIVQFFVANEMPISLKEIRKYMWTACLRYELCTIHECLDLMAETEIQQKMGIFGSDQQEHMY
jgi:hypothetical protein